jgi:hypothetical protein
MKKLIAFLPILSFSRGLMKKLLIPLMLLCPLPLLAANHYVCSTASGAHSGADWTNAWTAMSQVTWTRGDLYYFGCSNTFGAVTLSTATSGTSVIELRAATVADHGTSTGWSDSMVAQTVFNQPMSITTGYWTFNGQTRNSDWRSGYLLKWDNTGNSSTCSGGNVNISGNPAGLTFKYVEMKGTGTGVACGGGLGDNAIYTTSGAVSNFYFGYSYAHDTGNTQFQMNAAVTNTAMWEYNYIYRNHTSQNGTHDEAFSIYATNFIVRYNVFQDICGTGVITDAGANTPTIGPWEVYGNLIFWDAAYAALYPGSDGIIADLENGVVSFLGETMTGHVYFYNNTIAGIYGKAADTNGAGFSTLAVSGNYSGGTTVIYNNLWYRSAYTTGDFTSYCTTSCTQDYDAFYQGGIPSGDFQNPTETHGYTVTASTNPFVNFSASTIAGFQLATPDPFASHAGISIASPYNFDGFNQVTRAVNSTWDRGAEQIGAATAPPAAPTSVIATPH